MKTSNRHLRDVHVRLLYCQVLVPPSVELKGTGAGVLKCESYNGSRSQKSHKNIRRMLSVVNTTANFEKSRSKISHFSPQISEKSPVKSWRDCLNLETGSFPKYTFPKKLNILP